MTILGFAYAHYYPSGGIRDLVYNGTDRDDARAAVIAAQNTGVTEATEATSYRRGDRTSMTTSDYIMVGSVPVTPDPDEIIHVPAQPASLDWYSSGNVVTLDPDGVIVSIEELDMEADGTTPTWTWEERED